MPRCRMFLQVKPGSESDLEALWDRFVRECEERLPRCTGLRYGLLFGPFDWLIEFNDRRLHEVAFVVLHGRHLFREQLVGSVTLLEGDESPDATCKDGKNMVCVMLVKVKPGHDDDIAPICTKSDPLKKMGLKCTDVLFGPYDFIIEFPVADIPEMEASVRLIRKELRNHIVGTISMAKLETH